MKSCTQFIFNVIGTLKKTRVGTLVEHLKRQGYSMRACKFDNMLGIWELVPQVHREEMKIMDMGDGVKMAICVTSECMLYYCYQ